jgi:hypothetical protein
VSAAPAPIRGRCLCGGVRYEVTAPFVSSSYCHCTRCQRRTGSAASASARVAPGSLRILSGEELIAAWAPPQGFLKCFCTACGGALWSRDPDDAETISVRLGTVEGDPGIRPQYRQFVAYAAPWEPLPDDGLPRYDEGRPVTPSQ